MKLSQVLGNRDFETQNGADKDKMEQNDKGNVYSVGNNDKKNKTSDNMLMSL